MLDYFITTYNDDSGMHIFYFPGRDDKGHPLTRMSFLKSPDDYRYTRHSDGSIDYKVLERTGKIVCRVQNLISHEIEDIEL